MQAEEIKEQSKKNFWGTPEFEQAPPPPPPPSGGAAAPGAPSPAPAPAPGVTRAACEAGARGIVTMIDVTQRGIVRPVVNWKFRRKILQYMTEEEMDDCLLLMLEHEKGDPDYDRWLNSIEHEQKKKFLLLKELLDKREKLYGNIPFTAEEKKDLVEVWTEYGLATGKPLDPKVMAWLVTFGTLGKRGVSIMFE